MSGLPAALSGLGLFWVTDAFKLIEGFILGPEAAPRAGTEKTCLLLSCSRHISQDAERQDRGKATTDTVAWRPALLPGLWPHLAFTEGMLSSQTRATELETELGEDKTPPDADF